MLPRLRERGDGWFSIGPEDMSKLNLFDKCRAQGLIVSEDSYHVRVSETVTGPFTLSNNDRLE